MRDDTTQQIIFGQMFFQAFSMLREFGSNANTMTLVKAIDAPGTTYLGSASYDDSPNSVFDVQPATP